MQPTEVLVWIPYTVTAARCVENVHGKILAYTVLAIR